MTDKHITDQIKEQLTREQRLIVTMMYDERRLTATECATVLRETAIVRDATTEYVESELAIVRRIAGDVALAASKKTATTKNGTPESIQRPDCSNSASMPSLASQARQ